VQTINPDLSYSVTVLRWNWGPSCTNSLYVILELPRESRRPHRRSRLKAGSVVSMVLLSRSCEERSCSVTDVDEGLCRQVQALVSSANQ